MSSELNSPQPENTGGYGCLVAFFIIVVVFFFVVSCTFSSSKKDDGTAWLDQFHVIPDSLSLQQIRFTTASELQSYTKQQLVAHLRACQEVILDTTMATVSYLTPPEILSGAWGGSIGMKMQILAPESLEIDSNRIEQLRSTGILNTRYAVFGVRDGFDGTYRDYRLGRCKFGKRFSVDLCRVTDEDVRSCQTLWPKDEL